LGRCDLLDLSRCDMCRGLHPQKYSISYGYAANAQYVSVIAGIELMLFALLL